MSKPQPLSNLLCLDKPLLGFTLNIRFWLVCFLEYSINSFMFIVVVILFVLLLLLVLLFLLLATCKSIYLRDIGYWFYLFLFIYLLYIFVWIFLFVIATRSPWFTHTHTHAHTYVHTKSCFIFFYASNFAALELCYVGTLYLVVRKLCLFACCKERIQWPVGWLTSTQLEIVYMAPTSFLFISVFVLQILINKMHI